MSSTPDDGRGTGAGIRRTDAEVYDRRVEAGWSPDLERLSPVWRRGDDPPEVMIPAHVAIAHGQAGVDDYLESGWTPRATADLGLGLVGPAWVYGFAPTEVVWPMTDEHRTELGGRSAFPDFEPWAPENELAYACGWPADGSAPDPTVIRDWPTCGAPAEAELTNKDIVRAEHLRILRVCPLHLDIAYRSRWRRFVPPQEATAQPWPHALDGVPMRRVELPASGVSVSGAGWPGPVTVQDWMRKAADLLSAEARNDPLSPPVDERACVAGELRRVADELDSYEETDARRPVRWRRLLLSWPLGAVENAGIAVSEWAGTRLDRVRHG